MEKSIWIMENNKEIEVKVSEEVYRMYYSFQWKEEKQIERENRCMIPGKKGKPIRCTGNCSKCERKRTGTILSLDAMYQMPEYISDACDVGLDSLMDPEKYIINKERYCELYAAIESLPEDDRRIVCMFMKKYSEAAIGRAINMSQKGVNKRKQRIFAKLREMLEDKLL